MKRFSVFCFWFSRVTKHGFSSMTTYRTREGDVIDAVCRRHYGREAGAVEAVLEANPGLAELGPVLPPGTLVTLPDLPRPLETIHTVKLWD